MFPGKVDAYLANVEERREHDRRVNAAMLAKRRQLETFIAKNRAQASTASQARNKAKQLERLELIEIAGDEATDPASASPRSSRGKGPAVRTEQLAIGYPDRTVAERRARRRSTTARASASSATTARARRRSCARSSIRSSRWPARSAGATAARSASTPSTSTPRCREDHTVQDYLEHQAAPARRTQEILDVAGSFLFRGELVEKKIRVLSGGERARLVLAGLLLKQHNVLVLDEPGNHLDVETVEALAEALARYQGTVIFTSHDRHFMQRVATHVIEVRDGRVASYPASYDDYVYRMHKEIDAGLRAPHTVASPGTCPPPPRRRRSQSQRPLRPRRPEEAQSVERKIAKLDDEKKAASAALLTVTDAAEAQRLHAELTRLTAELATLEDEWLALSDSGRRLERLRDNAVAASVTTAAAARPVAPSASRPTTSPV